MLVNKNIILEILNSSFSKEIESTIIDTVMDMDSYDLEEYFQDEVDYASLNSINDIHIENYEIDEEEQMVSGELTVMVSIDGYVYINGETLCTNSCDIQLGFIYQFSADGETYSDLELEHIY